MPLKMPPPAAEFSWGQVSAFRLRRQHLLEPAPSIVEAARDLAGVQAQVLSCAEMSLFLRSEGVDRETVGTALWRDRSLIKLWAMRGTLHLFPADEMGLWAAALGSRRHYLREAWMRFYGITASDVEQVVEAVAGALDGRCLTREELSREIIARTGKSHLAERLASGWGGLLKPASYRGHLCFGPNRGRNVTFTRPELGSRPPEDQAVAEVARRFLRAYGPATHAEFARWWGGQITEGREIFAAMGSQLTPILVEGRRLWVLTADLETLTALTPVDDLLLLGGFDPYTLHLSPHAEALLPARGLKDRVFRTAGWVSPIICDGGRIAGVWTHRKAGRRLRVEIEPFGRLNVAKRRRAAAAAERIARFLELEPAIAFH